jgi:vacuolar protein sorting-associated protein 1
MLWEICNTFLIEYKKTIHGHLTGLKCQEALNNNSVHIVESLTTVLDEEYNRPMAEGLTSERIHFSIRKYEGNNMPGFPSINSFYHLIDPLLRKLKFPLMHCLSEVARLLSHICEEIIRELAREFPAFCDFILEKLSRLIENSRKKSETFI